MRRGQLNPAAQCKAACSGRRLRLVRDLCRAALLAAMALLAGGCAAAPAGLPADAFLDGRLQDARADYLWQAGQGAGGSRSLLLAGAAQMEIYLGELDSALEHFSQAAAALPPIAGGAHRERGAIAGLWHPDPHERGMLAVYGAMLHLFRGELDDAQQMLESGIRADQPTAAVAADGARSDNALLYWLVGRLAWLQGSSDAAFMAFGRASMARRSAVADGAAGPADPALLADPAAGNLVCVVELGIAPEKIATGPDGGLAALRPRPQRAVDVELLLDGKALGRPALLMDVGFQAATRGGAVIAGTRDGLALLPGEPGSERGPRDVGGAGPQLLAAITGSGADTRHWATLPAMVAVLAAEVPAGEHRLTLRFVDRHGVALPDLDQEHAVLVEAGQESWFLFRDLVPPLPSPFDF